MRFYRLAVQVAITACLNVIYTKFRHAMITQLNKMMCDQSQPGIKILNIYQYNHRLSITIIILLNLKDKRLNLLNGY